VADAILGPYFESRAQARRLLDCDNDDDDDDAVKLMMP
jgi:hypothetical protein